MVENVDETVGFYVNILGFDFFHGVPDNTQDVVEQFTGSLNLKYAMVTAGEIGISFQNRTSISNDIPVFESMQIGASATFYVEMDGFDALYEAICDKVEVVSEPHDTFYGMREFYIKDNNGYVLGFARPM